MSKKIRHFFHKILNRITLTALLFLVEFLWIFGMVAELAQYAIWINALFTVVSLFLILDILRRDVNPAYKIGWILLIALLPVFGWLMYGIFGNKSLTRRMHKKMDAVEREHRTDVVATHRFPDGAMPPRFVATTEYLTHHGGYPAHGNTDLKYYSVGDELFPDLLAALESAQRFIFLEYFIISPGVMLDAILDILRRKAADGVEVRLIYDDVGCEASLPTGFLRQMEKAGIKALPFNPIIPVFSIVMNHRDHRKIAIVDGKVAFTGGINIADEYINQKERFGHWKDTGLRLRGDAVWSFTVAFLNLWNAFRPTEKDYSAFRTVGDIPQTTDGTPVMVQPYFDSPLDEENIGENVYLEILAQAQSYVYIFTPYLIIDAELQTALCNAAKRGVDVRIVTPGVPDKKSVFMLTRSYYPVLRRAGVKIYEYAPGFIHAKSFLCDDTIATVGTINMDYRSLYLHFECGTLFYGGDAIAALRRDCEETMEKSISITSPEFGRARGFLRGLWEAILRAFGPLL